MSVGQARENDVPDGCLHCYRQVALLTVSAAEVRHVKDRSLNLGFWVFGKGECEAPAREACSAPNRGTSSHRGFATPFPLEGASWELIPR